MSNIALGLLWVFGILAAIGLVYNLATLFGWLAERRRRRGGETRVTARIFRPFCPTRRRCRCPVAADGRGRLAGFRCDAREIAYSLTENVDDRPRALPFVTTIPLAALCLLLVLDPILDVPLLWGQSLPEAVRSAFPEWLKWGWAGLAVLLALALAASAFFLPARRISRQWIVLHDDGRIGARGADFPVVDPRLPFIAESKILADHRCVLIRQDAREIVLVLGPIAAAAHPPILDIRLFTPVGAYRIGVESGEARVQRHLDRHFLGKRNAASGLAA